MIKVKFNGNRWIWIDGEKEYFFAAPDAASIHAMVKTSEVGIIYELEVDVYSANHSSKCTGLWPQNDEICGGMGALAVISQAWRIKNRNKNLS